MGKDYYGILKINRDAKPEQIKKAYRNAAKRHHPDVSPHEEDKFKEIQEAYETLIDPEKRAIYDNQYLEKPYRPLRYPSAKPTDFHDDLLNGIGELFTRFEESWINDMMDFLGEGKKNPKSHRVEIILSSAEARNGCEILLEVPLWVNCRRCGGNGTISGLICGLCRGRGEEKLEKKIRVRIPAGVRNGMRIEIPLKDRDLKGASLIATLKVSRH